ncbi:MAG: type I restriction enzyme HsdR N-terminal domain-containing protein [Oscillospiraceae bacterium]|nr:type I restriction enzyme HsdR N-terminal domain-containing protein [Oscillospiraceae bacterium]
MAILQIKRENGKIFCPLIDSWHIETPEEKVRQEFIKILVENYGYSLEQMAQELKVTNSQRGQGKARADIVIWKTKQDKDASRAAFIVVECKAENVRIREEDYYQGYNYASWAGASFFVTTNEKETKYFKDDERIVHYQDIVNGNVTVSFIPYKDGITDGDFLIEDYFSWDETLQAIMEHLIPYKKHPIKNLPNLSAKIKSEIESRYMDFKPEEFEGFVSLIDKICNLVS